MGPTLADEEAPSPAASPQDGNASLSLDGQFGYATGAGGMSLGGKTMTVQAWVKHDGDSQTDATIIRKGSGWELRFKGGAGEQEPQIYFDTGGGFDSVVSDEGIPANEWHHITAVYDGSQLSLYIDGQLDATSSESGDIGLDGTNPVRIGTDAGATGGYFSGRIDEVRVWNTALTKFQVQTNYFDELDGTESGLEAYYPMKEGTSGIEDVATDNNLAIQATASKVTSPPDALPVAPYTHAVPKNGSVEVSWSERLGATGQNDADAFTVYRSTNRDGSGRSPIVTTAGSTTNYTDTSVSNGQTYYYEVTAIDSNNQESDYAKSQPVRPYGTEGGASASGGGSLNLSNDGGSPDYATTGSGDIRSLSLGVGSKSAAGSKDMALEAWIKHDGDSDTDATIIRKGDGWELRFQGGGEEPKLYFDTGGGFDSVVSNEGITAGEWHHVAAVYDGNQLSLYIDGQLDATNSESGNIGNDVGQPVRVGTSAVANDEFFSGRIDDLRVWDTSRTASQIANNMSAEMTGNESDLVGYWRFDEVGQTSSVRGSSTFKTTLDLTDGASISTPGTYPVAPRVYARGDDGQALVTWDERVSGDASSFELYRTTSTSPTGATLVGTFSSGTTSTVDSGVSNGNTYYYWIASVDADGQQSDVSYAATARPTASSNPAGVAFNLSAAQESNATLGAPRPSLELEDKTMTVEAWVKYNETAQQDATIVRKGSGWELRLKGTSNNRQVYFDTGGGFDSVSSNSGIAAGEWHHVAGVYDGNQLSLYIDGQLDATSSESGNIGNDASRPVRIGAGDSATQQFFDGQIDEVRVWNVAREGTEINGTYRQELVGNESGLVGYFRGCNVAGNDVARSSAVRGMTLDLTSIECVDANIDLPGRSTGGSDSRLTGEVTNASGDPMAGVTVSIVDVDDSNSVFDTVTTDENGEFGPVSAPPGNYTADVDKSGFTVSASTVQLETGETEKIFVTLQRSTSDNQPPSAFFLVGAKADTTVDLDAADSTDPDGSIVEYRWDFDGDGQTDARRSGPTVTHTFASTGSYTVTLTVEDDDGATDQTSKTITVGSTDNQPPSASFLVGSKSGLTVGLDAGDSIDSDGSIVEYRWDFDGDGQTDARRSSPTVSHTFASGGSYTVTLTVEDDDGAVDRTSKSVSVQTSGTSGPSGPSGSTENATVTRTLSSSTAGPGGSVTVTTTVEINVSMDRLSLSETIAPAAGSASLGSVMINGNSASPKFANAQSDSVLVVLQNLAAGDTVTLTYDVTLPGSASTGDAFELGGSVTTPYASISIPNDTVTVQQRSGAAKYAGNDGIVQTSELRSAISDWVRGGINTSVLREVIQAWVSRSTV